MSSISDFFKKNPVGKTVASNAKGIGGALIGLPAIAQILTATGGVNKLKAALSALLALAAPLSAFGVLAFGGMRKAIYAVLKDTGSLEAALKRLQQIQGLQRIFTPLMGGADAAKRKVAELVQLATKGFDLGQWGEAARGLQLFTKGAYAGRAALVTVGDAAAKSGAGLIDTADAVGEFYAELREGVPIKNTADKLVALGVISDATANELAALQANGASVNDVFGRLTSELEKAKGGMASLANDVAAVDAKYAKAQQTLAAGFGEPFTESDIENTKNWTAAMVAVTPVVERVANWLQILVGGFSTAGSWLARVAAQSGVVRGSLEGLAYVFTGLVALVSALSGLAFATWLLKSAWALVQVEKAAGIAALALNGLRISAGLLSAATGIGLVIAVLATAAGIFLNFRAASERARKEMDAMRQAHRDGEKAIRGQIDAVKTLAQHHEALAAALEAARKAQEEYDAVIAKNGSAEEVRAAEEHLRKQQENVNAVAAKKASDLAPTETREAATRQLIERDKRLNEMAFTQEMETASPERRVQLAKQKAEELRAKEKAATSGVTARETLEINRHDLETELIKKKGELNPNESVNTAVDAKDYLAGRMVTKRDEVNALEAKLKLVGADAPQDSSVYAEMRARNSTDPNERANWERYAAERRDAEGNSGAFSTQAAEMEQQVEIAQRELEIATTRAEIEKQIGELKSRGFARAEDEYRLRMQLLQAELKAEMSKPDGGDPNVIRQIKGRQAALETQRKREKEAEFAGRSADERDLAMRAAQRAGNTEAVVSLRNLSSFASKLESAKSQGYNDDEAKNLAARQVEAEMADRIFNADKAGVVDSLQRIGGGGGVADSSMVDIARQQLDFQKQMRDYLAKLAAAGDKEKRESDIDIPFT